MTQSASFVELLRETNAKLQAGRDALLQGRLDAVMRASEEMETLAQTLSRLAAGQQAARLRDPEIAGLLIEIRRLGRGNSIIAGEMLRHFRKALGSLRRLESDRLYGPDGGEAALPTRRALGTA